MRALSLVWLGLAAAVAVAEDRDPGSQGTVESREKALKMMREREAAAPKAGQPAPDFELADPEGKAKVRLSDFKGKRPVVLLFGSYT